MGLNYHIRCPKVSKAVMLVRKLAVIKGGLLSLTETDLEEIAASEGDPEVIHHVREILRIISSPEYRYFIKDNEIHYRLFHRLPWYVLYGPEICLTCGCEINELGYCCCGGAVD